MTTSNAPTVRAMDKFPVAKYTSAAVVSVAKILHDTAFVSDLALDSAMVDCHFGVVLTREGWICAELSLTRIEGKL